MTGCGKPHCLHCSVRKMISESDENIDIHYTDACKKQNHKIIFDEADMVELPSEEILKILRPVQASMMKRDMELIYKTKALS